MERRGEEGRGGEEAGELGMKERAGERRGVGYEKRKKEGKELERSGGDKGSLGKRQRRVSLFPGCFWLAGGVGEASGHVILCQ